MNSYVDRLGLDFDPFEQESGDHGFFAGGGRQGLLQQLMEQACHSGALLAVTGEPGAGKSILARQLARDLGKDAVCVVIPATLFMSQAEFLDQVHTALGLAAADRGTASDTVLAFANDLALDARTLVLIIDDAQDLASDVHNLLATMLKRNPGGGLAVILMGESQLSGLLQRGLPPGLLVNLQQLSLPAFTSEDSLDYIRFKLASAGFRKPLPLNGGELGQIHLRSAGIPGNLNKQIVPALVAATTPDPAQNQAVEPSSLVSLGGRYWVAAGGLLVVLVAVLLLPSGSSDPDAVADQASGRQQISVAVDAASGPADTAAANTAEEPQPEPAATSSSVALGSPQPRAESVASARTAAGTDHDSPAASARPEVDTAAVTAAQQNQQAAADGVRRTDLSGFEQQLLNSPAQGYAVQIMGSRSPDSIQSFIDSTPALDGGGYFATTFQGQPWYVVVSGQFADRDSAENAINRLPPSVRELQPWVRSLADIQASIRSHYQLQ